MNWRPCFSASKVATLIGMNPFQPAFQELFQTMAQLQVPLCTDGFEYTRPEERVHLENHLMQLVSPHISERTTVEQLQKFETSLGVLGPLAPQAAVAARMRFGQVAERSTVENLKKQGRYGEGQYKRKEFDLFCLSGKTDGVYNGTIVEIKNRRSKFLGVTSYERPQFECYMRLFEKTEIYLCETLKKESGMEQRMTLVKSDDELWSTILERLTWVTQFIEEVFSRPFLQQLDEVLLEVHYDHFIKECLLEKKNVDNLE